jgi:hypothetical protein
MTYVRLYEAFGSTSDQHKLGNVIDKHIKDVVDTLWEYCIQNNIDPRDFKTYCEDTLKVLLSQKMITSGVQKRKEKIYLTC